MAPEYNLPANFHLPSAFCLLYESQACVLRAQHKHPTATSRRKKALQHVFPVALFLSY